MIGIGATFWPIHAEKRYSLDSAILIACVENAILSRLEVTVPGEYVPSEDHTVTREDLARRTPD